MWLFSDWYRDWFTTYSDEVLYSALNKATKLHSSNINFEFNLEFDIFCGVYDDSRARLFDPACLLFYKLKFGDSLTFYLLSQFIAHEWQTS